MHKFVGVLDKYGIWKNTFSMHQASLQKWALGNSESVYLFRRTIPGNIVLTFCCHIRYVFQRRADQRPIKYFISALSSFHCI